MAGSVISLINTVMEFLFFFLFFIYYYLLPAKLQYFAEAEDSSERDSDVIDFSNFFPCFQVFFPFFFFSGE